MLTLSLRCGRYVYMQLEKQLVKVSGLMITVMMAIVVDQCTDIIGKLLLEIYQHVDDGQGYYSVRGC